jgi:hypothetical protein
VVQCRASGQHELSLFVTVGLTLGNSESIRIGFSEGYGVQGVGVVRAVGGKGVVSESGMDNGGSRWTCRGSGVWLGAVVGRIRCRWSGDGSNDRLGLLGVGGRIIIVIESRSWCCWGSWGHRRSSSQDWSQSVQEALGVNICDGSARCMLPPTSCTETLTSGMVVEAFIRGNPQEVLSLLHGQVIGRHQEFSGTFRLWWHCGTGVEGSKEFN